MLLQPSCNSEQQVCCFDLGYKVYKYLVIQYIYIYSRRYFMLHNTICDCVYSNYNSA